MTIRVQDESAGPPPSGLDLVDSLCDDFEHRWRSGERPDIAEYLQDTAEPANRSTLFVELVHLDVAYRRQHNEMPRLDDYVARFPEYVDLLLKSGVKFAPDGSAVDTAQSEPTVTLRRPTRKFGRFEIYEELGSGAFGTVVRAYDPQLERDVAIKFPNKAVLEPDELRRFEREARAAARVRHPNVVRVYEIDLTGETPYIVSEFIKGRSLRDVIKYRRFEPREAAELCRKIAGGVHAVHEAGVIHRDLKPGNILIDEAGEPHVTDFGLARRDAPDATVSLDDAIVGTLAYMPPEQAKYGPKDIDRRADVYALGVILYELIAGTRPFIGNQQSLLDQIHHVDPVPPRRLEKGIPRDLETICLKAIAKSATSRYQSAVELADDLRRFESGGLIHARPTPFPLRMWRRTRRWRSAAAIGGLSSVGLLLAGLTLAGMLQTGDLPQEDPFSRQVQITTIPPRAEVAIVPLSPVNGEPQPSAMIRPDEVTPVELRLAPGDYLIVASIKDHGFHEVFRRVPALGQRDTEGYRHKQWEEDPETGVIRLYDIRIPAFDVVEGMVKVPGSRDFEMDITQDKQRIGQRVQVPSFYADVTECTFAEARQAHGNRLPLNPKRVDRGPNASLTHVDWDQAVHTAEKAGKRLLTAAEYQLIIASAKWVEDAEGRDVAHLPGTEPASGPQFIYGLRSDVAEWTSSWPLKAFDSQLPARSQRVVCGGDEESLERYSELNAPLRDPSRQLGLLINTWKPGLGFRCARSIKPRMSPEDFEVRVREDE